MESKIKNFYKSVTPAICAAVVSALYIVVDGIFVGQGVGTNGLAAVNIALPIVLFIMAFTMMLTMGGCTLTSIYLGKNNTKKANNIFSLTLWTVVTLSAILIIVTLFNSNGIAKILGSSEALLADSSDYILYYVLFSVFSCSAMVLSAFVKNDGNANLAMYGMIAGAITNIFLDWLFVFPLVMGVKGAAIASGLGQVVSCFILSTHFIQKKGALTLSFPKAEKGLLREIAKIGTPEFVTQMCTPISVLLFNILVMNAFGDIGVAAFSVVAYLLSITISVFVGLSQGLQPLWSRSLGENNHKAISFYLKKGIRLNITLSVFIYAVLFFVGENIITIFNADTQLVSIAKGALDIYGISFLFASINIIFTTYFLSVKKTKQSLTIAFIRTFIANPIFILAVPYLFGSSVVFVGIIISEALVMAIVIGLCIQDKAKAKKAASDIKDIYRSAQKTPYIHKSTREENLRAVNE